MFQPIGFVVFVCLSILAVGCSQQQVALPSRPTGLQLVSPTRLHWVDDGPKGILQTALVRSVCYYQGLPRGKAFTFANGEARTSAEMVQSLRLFWQTYNQASSPTALAQALEQRFLVYESLSKEFEKGLFTGYYEPEIAAVKKPRGTLNTPVYARPRDLVTIDLRAFPGKVPARRLVGRLKQGRLYPYDTRREIVQGKALRKHAQVIAYVNQIDLFFLQIQGSGVLRFANGKRIKIGYAASNGHPYRSLGAVMIQRGLLSRKEVTLQSIRSYLNNHPKQVSSLLFTNPSYVFFAQRNAFSQPIGNLGLPLLPGRSVAVDQSVLPPGGLLYVSTVLPNPNTLRDQPFNRFMLAHDKGGAIQGHGRVDVFFGRGSEVEPVAGRLKHPGRLFVLIGRKQWLGQPLDQPNTLTCTKQAKQAIQLAKKPTPSSLKPKQSAAAKAHGIKKPRRNNANSTLKPGARTGAKRSLK